MRAFRLATSQLEFIHTRRLPAQCLGVNEAADGPEDRRINAVCAAEARGDDRPVLDPADAVFNTHAHLAQCAIVSFLLGGGQRASFWFLVRRCIGVLPMMSVERTRARRFAVHQAAALRSVAPPSAPLRSGLAVAGRASLFGQSPIAAIGLDFAPVGQSLQGLELITQLLVVHFAGYRFADRPDRMLAIGHPLRLEGVLFLLAGVILALVFLIAWTRDALLSGIH
jgi:hypothetical protein